MGNVRYMKQGEGFLGLEDQNTDSAQVVVIPFGLERSVSYGLGTRRGPRAILKASHQLELFDEVFWEDCYQHYGIATIKEPKVAIDHVEALDQIEALVSGVLAQDKFPLTLGGEHSLTVGAMRPFAEKFDDLVVLQIDAHADLRDSYEGNIYSHACAMRRVLDFKHISLVSLGVRSISSEEIPFLEENEDRVSIFWAKDKQKWDFDQITTLLRGKNIYLSFDADGFDASLMPATGTPEPGGLFFDEVEKIIALAASAGTLVGADIVELAPEEPLKACDFTIAKLAYKILNYSFRR